MQSVRYLCIKINTVVKQNALYEGYSVKELCTIEQISIALYTVREYYLQCVRELGTRTVNVRAIRTV